MDRMVSDGSHLFRNGTAFFFSANDAISILENIGQIGIKIPSFFHKSLIDLNMTRCQLIKTIKTKMIQNMVV